LSGTIRIGREAGGSLGLLYVVAVRRGIALLIEWRQLQSVPVAPKGPEGVHQHHGYNLGSAIMVAWRHLTYRYLAILSLKAQIH
jgi:hypothetical protein